MVEEIYSSELDRIKKEGDRKIIASHLGEFSQDFVYSFCDEFEKILISKGDKRTIVKRIFSILLEGMQNVRIHGNKDVDGVQNGYLIVAEREDHYKIVIANLINSDNRNRLKTYLDEINSYSLEELKERYLYLLQKEFNQDKSGGGLGIITTRLKSGNNLLCSIHPIDESNLLFSFKVIVNR